MGLLGNIKKLKEFILFILFPTKCLGCNKKDEILCDLCLSKIQNAERELDKKIMAVFDYRDPVIKKAIWELKYYHKKYLGEKLGQILYNFLLEDISEMRSYASGKPIIVIPVPISTQRAKKRGYNQSNSIALSFCDQNKNIFEFNNNIVFKNKETLPQAKIRNRNERLQNIKNAFSIRENTDIKGRTIIIIDDVTTTGGTIGEIIKILEKAGAKKVIGFAVSH